MDKQKVFTDVFIERTEPKLLQVSVFKGPKKRPVSHVASGETCPKIIVIKNQVQNTSFAADSGFSAEDTSQLNRTKWTCPICEARTSFRRKEDLITHLQSKIHATMKAYICQPCSAFPGEQEATFLSSLSNLRVHALSFHFRRGKSCDACGKLCANEQKFVNHFRESHTIRNPIFCPICDLAFPEMSFFSKHLDYHLVEGKTNFSLGSYVCDLCSGNFTKNLLVMNHLIEEHGYEAYEQLTSCFKCGSVFTKNELFAEHLALCTPNTEEIRSSVFAQEKLSRKTEEKKRSKGSPPPARSSGHLEHLAMYQCLGCQEQFMNSAQLAEHAQIEHCEPPFPSFHRFGCSECRRGFDKICKLDQHMLTHQISFGGHKCTICQGVFSKKQECEQHIQSAHANCLPFICPICCKRFLTGTKLRTHLSTHDKKHICELCAKKFSQKSDLDRHSLIHKDLKPYSCSYCNEKFRQTASLKAHIKKSHILPAMEKIQKEKDEKTSSTVLTAASLGFDANSGDVSCLSCEEEVFQCA